LCDQSVSDGGAGGGFFSQKLPHGANAAIADAAGDDEAEVVQVGIDVEGEAVGAPPAANADTHGADLFFANPDACAAFDAVAFDTVRGEGADDGFFHEAHVFMQAQVLDGNEGIKDELAGAVKGDLAAAISLMDGNAAGAEYGFGGDYFLRGAASANGNGGGVLGDEDEGTEIASDLRLLEVVLKFGGFGVVDAAKVSDLNGGH